MSTISLVGLSSGALVRWPQMLDAPSLALAFTAGFVSFVSPCCLPLAPGYLATVSGVEPSALGRGVDARVVGRSARFVGTFSLLFVLLGLGATAIGSFLLDNQPTLNAIAATAIVMMGVLFIVTRGSGFRPRCFTSRPAARPPASAERDGQTMPRDRHRADMDK